MLYYINKISEIKLPCDTLLKYHMPTLPTILVTGFLGSGKTTVVNHILEQNKDHQVGLLVNEFGDARLESSFIHVLDAKPTEFQAGCLCHIPVEQIVAGVDKLLANHPHLTQVVIEASGLTDPVPLMQLLNTPKLKDKLKLQLLVCVVDGLNWQTHKREQELFLSQLLFADVILISKTDLISSAQRQELEDYLHKLLPRVPRYAAVEFNYAAILSHLHPERDLEILSSHVGVEHDGWQKIFVQNPNMWDKQEVLAFIHNLPPQILRVKARFIWGWQPETVWLVNKVGARIDIISRQLTPTDAATSALLILGKGLTDSEIQQLEQQIKNWQWVQPVGIKRILYGIQAKFNL
jgi:G3E family GTPase